MKTYNDGIEWAAQWVEDSLKGEANERVIEFGKNMAMTLRAATQDTKSSEASYNNNLSQDGQASDPSPPSAIRLLREIRSVLMSLPPEDRLRSITKQINALEDEALGHSQSVQEMQRCDKCDKLFRYPPTDNKPNTTTCAWCSPPLAVAASPVQQNPEVKHDDQS